MIRALQETLTIGQLARAAEVPTSTIRFYERRGLLKPDARTGSNYRAYSAHSLERLKFIRAAQASGFSLKDIREMLSLTYSDAPPCAEIAALIEHRLNDVKQRLRELKRVSRVLTTARKSCCKGGPDWCSEIVRLKTRKSCEDKSIAGGQRPRESVRNASRKIRPAVVDRGLLTLH